MIAGSSSTASIRWTGLRATDPTVTPVAQPITSTVSGAFPNRVATCPERTWVGMSSHELPLAFPFTCSEKLLRHTGAPTQMC